MTHRSCCDVLLPHPAGSRVTNSLRPQILHRCVSAVSCSSCSVSEITLRQHSNTHLYWDFVLLFTRRRIYTKFGGIISCCRASCTALTSDHVLICIGDLMPQRITASSSSAQLLCHAGNLHWKLSSWYITICSDRALCELTVDVPDWMSVH